MYYEEFDVEGDDQEVQNNQQKIDDESMDSFDKEMAE